MQFFNFLNAVQIFCYLFNVNFFIFISDDVLSIVPHNLILQIALSPDNLFIYVNQHFFADITTCFIKTGYVSSNSSGYIYKMLSAG